MNQETNKVKGERSDDEKGGVSATIGVVCLVALGVGLIWHDRMTVNAVLAQREAVSVAEAFVSACEQAEPEDAEILSTMANMERVVTARGGANCSPLFDLLGREGTLRGARTNLGTALAIQARSEVLRGDMDAALEAAKRFEAATEDDLLPAEVDAWVWRVNELLDHPGVRELDRGRLRRALFADAPVEEALQGSD